MEAAVVVRRRWWWWWWCIYTQQCAGGVRKTPTGADDMSVAEGLADVKGWKRLARARRRSGGGGGESSSSEGPRRIDCGGGGGGVPVLRSGMYVLRTPSQPLSQKPPPPAHRKPLKSNIHNINK